MVRCIKSLNGLCERNVFNYHSTPFKVESTTKTELVSTLGASSLGLADKCRGLTHADFDSCDNLMDAAVLVLVGTCRGLTYLTYATFINCYELTDAAKATVREQHPNCTFGF